MEVALMRANVLESNESIMARFLHGLNRKIHDIVELYHYTSLDNPVHQATRRRLASKGSYPNSSYNWKGNEREKEQPRKDKNPKKGSDNSFLVGVPQRMAERKKLPHLTLVLHPKDTLPLNASNKRNMVMREDGNVKSESSCEESSSLKGDLLMVKRLMNTQEKLCSITIDGGSSISVTSLKLVEKLNLFTLVHPRPYKLQWLSDKVNLKPLSPRKVSEDQLKMKIKREKNKMNRKKKEIVEKGSSIVQRLPTSIGSIHKTQRPNVSYIRVVHTGHPKGTPCLKASQDLQKASHNYTQAPKLHEENINKVDYALDVPCTLRRPMFLCTSTSSFFNLPLVGGP
ncbi:hypothetical protein CR513_29290, partial [Mucuna pruriens]